MSDRDRLDYVLNLGGLHDFVRAHVLGGNDLLVALHQRDHIATDGASHLDEHESDGAAADDGHGVADLHAGFVQAAQHASQRLGHGGIFEGDVRRNDQHVGFNNAPRYADIFRVGTVIEEQILAKILLVLGAVEAHLAGRGIERHHAHTFLEAMHAFAYFLDDAGQFMSEERRRNDHSGVVATLIHLEVGAAGESDLDFDEYFTLFHAGNRHSFNLEIFFAVQDGGRHFSVQCELPSQDSRFRVLPG